MTPETTKKEIRTRLAPSPTGFLHFGTARVGLFNWIFAKHNGGKFILRIEDTDKERSKKEFEENIISGLKWLGLNWDEEVYRQSDRLDIYEKYLKKLLEENKAYYCYCTKEELELERQAMLASGLAPKYSGRCRNVGQIEGKTAQVIRIKVPEIKVEFNDLIRGDVVFDAALIGDIAIAKNLRSPLYNFAVVIDDFEMRISHVIRGEDHLPNTPKQIIIGEALGMEQPKFAHLPLVLAPDRSKMSKRNMATALSDYQKDGYLPEAIMNFIVLLGWHSKEDKEIISLEEITKEFDLGRVQKSGAIFNIDRLDWINSQYLKNYSDQEIAERLKPLLAERNLTVENNLLIKIIGVEKARMKKLTDFFELAEFFITLADYKPELLIWKQMTKETAINNLKAAEQIISNLDESEYEVKKLEEIIKPLTETNGRGEVLWPLRVALSGKDASPGPFEIMEILGKKETLKRIKIALSKIG